MSKRAVQAQRGLEGGEPGRLSNAGKGSGHWGCGGGGRVGGGRRGSRGRSCGDHGIVQRTANPRGARRRVRRQMRYCSEGRRKRWRARAVARSASEPDTVTGGCRQGQWESQAGRRFLLAAGSGVPYMHDSAGATAQRGLGARGRAAKGGQRARTASTGGRRSAGHARGRPGCEPPDPPTLAAASCQARGGSARPRRRRLRLAWLPPSMRALQRCFNHALLAYRPA